MFSSPISLYNFLDVLLNSNFVPSFSLFNYATSFRCLHSSSRSTSSNCYVPSVVPHCLSAFLLVPTFVFHLSQSSFFSITSFWFLNFSLTNFSLFVASSLNSYRLSQIPFPGRLFSLCFLNLIIIPTWFLGGYAPSNVWQGGRSY